MRVGPHDGSMTCPVTTSKLRNQDKVPCRMYSRLASQDMAWLHRQVGMLALQCLHAGQFIHANRAFSLCGSFRSFGIHLTPITNLLVALRVGNFRQPVPEAVRL